MREIILAVLFWLFWILESFALWSEGAYVLLWQFIRRAVPSGRDVDACLLARVWNAAAVRRLGVVFEDRWWVEEVSLRVRGVN
jgi:hypothetical protein